MFITATLPRPLLHLLNTRFGISDFNSIIRGSSNRSDISYRRVYFRAKEDRDDAVRNTIREIEHEDSDVRGKILISVTNKKQGEDLADLLQSEIVYSGKEDLQRVLQELIQSRTQRTLITTSVLEVGMDIKQIKYTISIEPVYSLTSVVQSSGRIRQRGVSYIICQQPTKNGRDKILGDGGVRREVQRIEDFNEVDKAWYKLLTIEATCLRTPISQFLDHIPYRCQGHKDDLCSVCAEKDEIKEETRGREEAAFQERRIRWLELEERLLNLKEMYCMYCILDPYNTSNSINHSSVECKRLPEDKAMLQVQKQVQAELRTQHLPAHECGCFRCLMPKNICTKQQENNGLAEDVCFMGRFLPDTIAVLFQFGEGVEGMIPGIPNPSAGLGGFVNGMLAPSGWYTLKTVRLVEMLGKVDIIGLVEELEDDTGSETGDEEGEERSDVVGAADGEGQRAGEENSEEGLDLKLASPGGGWEMEEGEEWWIGLDMRSPSGRGGGRKRRASTRLSETFAEEKARLRRRGMEVEGVTEREGEENSTGERRG